MRIERRPRMLGALALGPGLARGQAATAEEASTPLPAGGTSRFVEANGIRLHD